MTSEISCGSPNCEAGWIFMENIAEGSSGQQTKTDNINPAQSGGVVPCKDCNYERWHIWNTSATKEEYFERLRARGKHNRIKAYEIEEEHKTRIL